jgi:hypothetical protein
MRSICPILRIFVMISVLFTQTPAFCQISVSANGRFLQTADGKPFFWLGDTNWELFHRATREEALLLMKVRKEQGFTILQAVALAEYSGLHGPNRYGDLPLINEDPTRLAFTSGNDPADSSQYDYWDHVEFIIQSAEDMGLYIGLLPTWGDKVAHMWGEGPVIFNPDNAKVYAKALAERFAKHHNIIWILGGDRPAIYKWKKDGVETAYNDLPVWNAMAEVIQEVAGPNVFLTYHPAGGENSTSQFLSGEKWLDMNAFQSSHGSREIEVWKWAARDYAIQPAIPFIDMEPCYEDHPVNPWDGKWTRERGYFTDYDIRARIYRSVFGGACGVTYGDQQVWQMLDTSLYEPVFPGDTILGWQKALHSPAATQMKYLKNLLLSLPYFSRIPDLSFIASDTGKDYTNRLAACRNSDGSYALVYLPQNKPVAIQISKLSKTIKKASWFDPRTGKRQPIMFHRTEMAEFVPPAGAKDWVLILQSY